MKSESELVSSSSQHDVITFVETEHDSHRTYRDIDGVHVQFDVFGAVAKLNLPDDQSYWMHDTQSYGVIRWRTKLAIIRIVWKQTSHAISLLFKGPGAELYAQEAFDFCRRRWLPTQKTCKVKLHSTGGEGPDEGNAIVELMGLSPKVTVKDIRSSLPEHIKSDTPVTYSDVTGAKVLTCALRKIGELHTGGLIPHSCRPAFKLTCAFGIFMCPTEAEKVVKYHGFECSMGTVKRRLDIAYEPDIEFWAPTKLLNAIKIQVNILVTSTWVVHCPDITFKSDFATTKETTAYIKIEGKHLKSLRRAQADLMALFEGEVVTWYDEPLWNEAIRGPSALFILDKLSRENNVYLLRDTINCVIKLYGGCFSNRMDVKQFLYSRFGAPDAVYAIDDSDEPCVVCTGPAEKFLEMSCGHIYCLACFEHQVDSCGGRLPLQCYGRLPGPDGTWRDCDHIFTLADIEELVPRSVFEDLLIDSLKIYLEVNFAQYRNCPTRDCVSIYRHTEEQEVTTCIRCFESTCSACGLEAHTGRTCEEHEERRDGGAALMKKWMAEQVDMKHCPSCTVPMWKSFGCDHMQCRCGEHFCWICLAKFGKNDKVGEFNSGQKVYRHLQRVHHSIGGGYVMERGVFVLRDGPPEEDNLQDNLDGFRDGFRALVIE